MAKFRPPKIGYQLLMNGLGQYYVTKMTNGHKSDLYPNKERDFFYTKEEAEAAIESDWVMAQIHKGMNTWETLGTYYDWEDN